MQFKFASRPISCCVQLGILVSLTGPATSFAQPAERKQRSSTIDEIVITAERREESLQDTPISVTAFNAESLEALGVANANDMAAFTPNLMTNSTPSGFAGVVLTMRGVQTEDMIVTMEPAVGLYLDGVPVSKGTGSLFEIADLQRMEILRGPQGTLYGRNTIGGAINLITRKPSGEWGARFKGTVGTYETRNAQLTVDVPLVDNDAVGKLAMKATLATFNREGYETNVLLGEDLDDRDQSAVHLQLLWEPTEQTSLLYSYDTTRIDENAEAFSPVAVSPLGALFPTVPYVAPYVVGKRPDSYTLNAPHDRYLDADGHSLTITTDVFDGAEFVSITGYREFNQRGGQDIDGSPATLLHSYGYSDYEQWTQEFRLVGSALTDQLDYVLGFYYQQDEGGVMFDTVLDSGFAFDPSHAINGVPFTDRFDSDFDNEVWAVFGQADYHLTEQMTATFGLRYTREHRRMSKIEYIPGMVTIFPAADSSENFSNLSPVIGLNYEWSDDLMTYLKLSRGYKSGGFNARDVVPVLFEEGFDEEKLTAYEIGFKSTLMDQRVILNGAAFYSDYKDHQVNIQVPTAAGFYNYIANAAQADIFGVELEMQARLTPNLDLLASVSWLDTDYSEFRNPVTGADLSHYDFAYAPDYKGYIGLNYTFPDTRYGTWSARIDATRQDDIVFGITPSSVAGQDAYSLVNARVTLDRIPLSASTSNVAVSLWVKNLTDRTYHEYGLDMISALGWAGAHFGDPRTWGMDLTVEF